MKKSIQAALLGIGLIVTPVLAWAEESVSAAFSLPAYLQEVQAKNGTYLGAVEKREGSIGVGREADLVFSPSFFTNVQAENDQEQTYGALFSKTETQNYSSGISETSPYGLQTKLYYDFDNNKYYASGQANEYYDASPILELSLPILKNGFGRSDRATQEATRAQAESDAWSSENDRKMLLSNAEIAYWQLVVDRELVDIQRKGLEASQAIYDYDNKLAGMNLTDKADVLQAKANLESKKLDLKSAQDNESIALRSFNAYRNVSAKERPLVLPAIDYDRIREIALPEEHATRADVRSAEADARVAAANARIKEEDNKPSLNLYVDYELNGEAAGSSNSAFSNSFSSDKPTTTVGFKFSVPLDFFASSDVRAGARRKEQAAKLTYEQKLRDQESDWQTLVAKLKNARERLEMTFTIEAAQKQKLEYERDRLKRGRTTTYQILQFEQDYLSAESSRVNAAYDILNLCTQIVLYRDTSDHKLDARTGVKP
jgi:outer membrane protein TolC